MQIQKISNRQVNNYAKNNNSPSFGMYFHVDAEVIDTFEKTTAKKAIDCGYSRDEMYDLCNEVLITARRIITSVMGHNENKSNHIWPLKTIRIKEIDAGISKETSSRGLQDNISFITEDGKVFSVPKNASNPASSLQQNIIDSTPESSDSITNADNLRNVLDLLEKSNATIFSK